MDIKTAHDKFYEMLVSIDEICKKEKIRWFLEGGTELGAVREHDFIAWDDDVDIKVFRRDYERFKQALAKYLPENYKVVEPEDLSPAFYDYVTRIVDFDTPLHEDTEEDRYYGFCTNHFHIDVFIIDNAPDRVMLQKLHLFKFKFIYGLALSKRYRIDYSNYKPLEAIMVKTCALIGSLFMTDQLLKIWRREMTKYNKYHTGHKFFSNSMILRGLNFYGSDLFRKSVRFPIRDRKFPVPAGYDEELTMHYGDYMTPVRDDNFYKPHF